MLKRSKSCGLNNYNLFGFQDYTAGIAQQLTQPPRGEQHQSRTAQETPSGVEPSLPLTRAGMRLR
jgi:hypothetical protein